MAAYVAIGRQLHDAKTLERCDWPPTVLTKRPIRYWIFRYEHFRRALIATLADAVDAARTKDRDVGLPVSAAACPPLPASAGKTVRPLAPRRRGASGRRQRFREPWLVESFRGGDGWDEPARDAPERRAADARQPTLPRPMTRSYRRNGLPQARIAVTRGSDSNGQPCIVVIQRQCAPSREFEAGNQRAGNRHATAQHVVGLFVADLRQKGRQCPALGPLAEQLLQAPDRITDPPERERAGAIRQRWLMESRRRERRA